MTTDLLLYNIIRFNCPDPGLLYPLLDVRDPLGDVKIYKSREPTQIVMLVSESVENLS